MNSLRTRLLSSAGCVLFGFVLLTALALDSADRQRAEAAVQDRMQGLTYTLLGALNVGDDGSIDIAEDELPDPRLKRPDSGLAAVIVSPDGGILWHSLSTMDLHLDIPAADVGQWRFRIPDARSEQFQLILGISWVVGDSEQLFRLAVLESPKAFLQQRTAFRKSLWLSLGLAAVVLLGLLLAILHWGLLPLGRLASEVTAVEAGNQESIDQLYPSELQPLAAALNAVLRHERRRQLRYRNALADLAHSLKTPLAALRSQAAARDHQDNLEHMQQIIDYQLRKAAAGSGRSFAAPLPLAPLVKRVVGALQKVHAERGLQFNVDIPDGLSLRMEQGDLLEIFGNLLDNAARFAAHNIQIKAWNADDLVKIAIQDDGPGFPSENRGNLLERGVRADSQNPGQGIGLAVVAEIVHANDGTIQLMDADSGGAKILIQLPGS